MWTEETRAAKPSWPLDEAGFLAELDKRFGCRLGEIALAGPRQSFPLDLQIARAFVADRLALIGDAAHVVHPLAGQGLNIGMRDVAALAEIIVEAARLGLDIGAAPTLERYERWRRFDSAFSAAVMDGLNRLFSNDSAPLRTLRDLGLGLVDRAPALKRFLVREAAGATGTVPRLLRGADALARVELARFLGQHDGNAVADRVGEARGAADQLLALGVVVERGLGQRTDQDLEQLRIEPPLAAALGCVASSCVS